MEPVANPFDARLPEQREPRRVEAKLAGYETVRRELSMRYDQSILLKLRPTDLAGSSADAAPSREDAGALSAKVPTTLRRRPPQKSTGPSRPTIDPVAEPVAPPPSKVAPPPEKSPPPAPAPEQIRGKLRNVEI